MDYNKYKLTEEEINRQCKLNLEKGYRKIKEDALFDKQLNELLAPDEFE